MGDRPDGDAVFGFFAGDVDLDHYVDGFTKFAGLTADFFGQAQAVQGMYVINPGQDVPDLVSLEMPDHVPFGFGRGVVLVFQSSPIEVFLDHARPLDEFLNPAFAEIVQPDFNSRPDNVGFDIFGNGDEAYALRPAAASLAGCLYAFADVFEVLRELTAHSLAHRFTNNTKSSYYTHHRRFVTSRIPRWLIMCRFMKKIGSMDTVDDVIVPPPEPGRALDFEAMFGRKAPVEMEIGTGKGGFLLERARALPGNLFFGVEWANKYLGYAADRMLRWGITNVRLMRTDARHLVIHHLPPACLTILHIYHPDPWPKKRHHKRRLIQPAFIAAATDALVSGGRIAIQTDHSEYFEQIREVVGREKRLGIVPFDVPEAGVNQGRVATNFEIKYLREGRSMYQIALQKTQ